MVEKPPILFKDALRVLLPAIVCIAIGLALLGYSIYGCIQYNIIKNRAATLDAEVFYVEETTDVDNEWVYDVYVRYQYAGKDYQIKYIRSMSSSWLDRIGEIVSITVDSLYPNVQLKNKIDGPFFAMFFGAPILGIGVGLSGRRCRMSYVEFYGMSTEMNYLDAVANFKRPSLWHAGMAMLGAYVLCGALGITVSAVFGVMMGLGILLLPLAVIIQVKYRKTMPKVNVEPDRVSVWTVKDKKTGRDSDGDITYELLLSNQEKELWQTTNKKRYMLTDVGDSVEMIRRGNTTVTYFQDHDTGRYVMDNL